MKVLSIDMDFIMEPCIQLYNDLVSSERKHEQLWENIENERDVTRHLSYSTERLNFIKSLLLKYKDVDIYIGDNHSTIANMLLDIAEKGNSLFITTIDHHHDLYYSGSQKEIVEKYNDSTVSSWLYWGMRNYNVESVLWINNPNSSIGLFSEHEGKIVKRTNKFELDFVNTPDVIYITTSLEWIPPQYTKLILDTVRDLKVKKYYKGSYEQSINTPLGDALDEKAN